MGKKRSSDKGQGQHELLTELRRKNIGEAAYFKAELRGFAPGFELEDWLKAEREVG